MILVGVRAEESYKRAHRQMVDRISKKHIIFKPIFGWKEYDVWQFIDDNRLAYPSLYDEGFGRIGCVICPMNFGNRSGSLLRNMEAYPHLWNKFKETMRKWFSLYRDGDFEVWWEHYIFGDPVDLSKIKRRTIAEVKCEKSWKNS